MAPQSSLVCRTVLIPASYAGNNTAKGKLIHPFYSLSRTENLFLDAKNQARGGSQDGFEEVREIAARGHHERQPLGLGMLSPYLDDFIAVVGFLAAWLSSFTLALALDNSTRTAVAIFAESILYRAGGAGEVRVLRK